MESRTYGHLNKIIKSLKNLKRAEDEDHIWYAKRKRDCAALGIAGGAVSVLGFIGAAFIPVTGGVSAALVGAAAVAGGSGAGLGAVSGAAGIYSRIAENSALSMTVDLAQKDLNDFACYLRRISKTDQVYKGLVSNSLTIMGGLIQINSLVLLTANGTRLAGYTAFQYLGAMMGPGVTIISIAFNVWDYTQNNKIVQLEAQSELSRKLEKIICDLVGELERVRGS